MRRIVQRSVLIRPESLYPLGSFAGANNVVEKGFTFTYSLMVDASIGYRHPTRMRTYAHRIEEELIPYTLCTTLKKLLFSSDLLVRFQILSSTTWYVVDFYCLAMASFEWGPRDDSVACTSYSFAFSITQPLCRTKQYGMGRGGGYVVRGGGKKALHSLPTTQCNLCWVQVSFRRS